MHSIQDRFSAVIRQKTSKTRRYAEMEALTGIPATSWNKAFNGKQRPTPEMLQAVGQLWPEFAYWLLTGVTDARHGHVSCRDGTPCQFYPERSYGPRSAARPYFMHTLEMFRHTYGDKNEYPTEVMEKEAMVQLVRLELAREGEELALQGGDATLDALKDMQATLAAAESRARKSVEKTILDGAIDIES